MEQSQRNEPTIEMHASFFPVGSDQTVQYRFRGGDWPKQGANGKLRVDASGVTWEPGHFFTHGFRSWSLGWDEVDTIEAVPMWTRMVNSNLRVLTARGVVEMSVATANVDEFLEVARYYLRPGERDG
jgi:hypothetical protein